MADIRNINNYNCIYHSTQRYIFRMKNLDLGQTKKLYAFLFTPPWQSNRVKKKKKRKILFLKDFQTSNIKHVDAKLYFLSIKARWGCGYLLKNVKSSRVGCAARPALRCWRRAAGKQRAGDAVTHGGSSRPPPPHPTFLLTLPQEPKIPAGTRVLLCQRWTICFRKLRAHSWASWNLTDVPQWIS